MRFSLLTTLAVVSLALLAAPIGATPTPTATAGNATNTTTTATASTTPTASSSTNLSDVVTEVTGPRPTAQSSQSTPTDTRRIDSQTVIVESEYRANESMALITLRSRAAQTVTFTDAGRFRQGGQVPVQVEVLRPGETATFEVPVTEVDGWAGVAISTERTRLYSEIVKRPSGGGLDILKALSSLQAWFAGVTVAFTWMIIAGYNVLRREDGSPRVAT